MVCPTPRVVLSEYAIAGYQKAEDDGTVKSTENGNALQLASVNAESAVLLRLAE
jgi:hypothetical protein